MRLSHVTMGLFFTLQLMNSWAGTMGEPVDLWSGFYYGLSAEAASGTSTHSVHQNEYFTTPTLINSVTGAGVLKGTSGGGMANLFLGYNKRLYQHPGFMYGLQLSGNVYNSMHTLTQGIVQTQSIGLISGVEATDSYKEYGQVDSNVLITLAARAGVLVQEPTLLYGLVGVVEGRFTNIGNVRPTQLSVLTVPDVDMQFTNTFWKSGLFLGLGLEHKLDPHWSLLLEYHYMNFNFNYSNQQNFVSNNGSVGVSGTLDFNRTTHANYHFNSGALGVTYRC